MVATKWLNLKVLEACSEMKQEHRSMDFMANLRLVLALRQNYGLLQRPHHHPSKRFPQGLVEDARIIFNDYQCTVQHTYRDGNLCADAMAKLGADQPEDILVVNDPPVEIKELLVSDMVGLARKKA
ncbi:hypothetical protein ACSBR1_041590 [Camellia fascicularis]